MAEQYANVTVNHKMHGDRRFVLLAELGGWTVGDACWRMIQLWARCTALHTDLPPAREIRIHLGLGGEQLLVDAELGERQADGSIRVIGGGLTGGDTDRFGWYEPVRSQQREAGTLRARGAVRAAGGRFSPSSARSSDHQRITSALDTAGPAGTSGSPAGEIPAPASGFRIPDQREDLSLARARATPSTSGHGGQPGSGQPGSGQPGTRATQQGASTPGQSASSAAGNVAEPQLGPEAHRAEHPTDPEDLAPAPARLVLSPAAAEAARTSRRAALGRLLWDLLAQVRAEVIAELGLTARPLGLFELEARDLREKLREVPDAGLDTFEADARHAIAMAKAQALATGSVQYLSGSLFTDGAFRRAVSMALEDAQRARAGPDRSAARAPEPIRKIVNLT